MKELFTALAAGERVSDTAFDKLFDTETRRQARIHWTPVAVALTAARFLSEAALPGARARILDLGSNVGKFCLVGALSTPASFEGLELRRDLVTLARETARTHNIERVRFRLGDALEFDWSGYDGVYLYNPFYESLDLSIRIDSRVDLSRARYERSVEATRERLGELRLGARVALYYGFGGEMPEGFRKIDESDDPHLELWERV